MTIERTIRFYATRLTDRDGAEMTDQSAAWSSIKGASFEQRKVEGQAGYVEVVQVQRMTDGAYRGRFHRNRRTDFPLIGDEFDEDYEQPLNPGPGKTLRDPAHFVWWDLSDLPTIGGPSPREGLLAMEYSRPAPKASALTRYVREIFDSRWTMQVLPTISPDKWAEVERHGFEVKQIEVRVPATELFGRGEQDPAALDIVDDLEGTRALWWTVKPHRGRTIFMRSVFARLLRRAEDTHNTVKLSFEDGATLDLGNAMMAVKVQVPRAQDNARHVDSKAMWRMIRDVVHSNRSDLGRALRREWAGPIG